MSDIKHKNVTSPSRFLNWVVTLLVPIALVLTAVRLVMAPWFLHFEYNTPNFPQDLYGFTKDERLYWSKIAVDYLLNPEGISFLEDLRFSDGTPVYNARELHHMVDVKNTVTLMLIIWYVSLGALASLGVWAWWGSWWKDYTHGLARGGWLTVLILGSLIFFVLISFGVLFVAFHNVFFQPGTWMFNFSDTLIRLFPERFWRDIFIIVGAITIGGGLALGFGLRRKQ